MMEGRGRVAYYCRFFPNHRHIRSSVVYINDIIMTSYPTSPDLKCFRAVMAAIVAQSMMLPQ